jgi:hypothetical protein
MLPSNAFSSSLISRTKTLIFIVSILAVSGVAVELVAGLWDATSHLMREPERFWTIQHVAVYSGVGMISCSAILALLVTITNSKNRTLSKGLKVIIIGTVLQLVGGYADSISHDMYGIDGLVSASHLVLEIGLALSALGGFMTLCLVDKQKTRKIIPVAIMTVLLSIAWIGFNLTLLFGSVVLCIPVYEIFSSGCAVL